MEASVRASNETRATDTTRRRYDRVARTYDLKQALPERLFLGRWRRDLWSRVGEGSVLEVGVGTGLNFPFYPSDRRVVAIDLSEEMLRRALARVRRLGTSADLLLMDAQHLDFPDESFDWVVATFVFCSIPDPVQGLREVRRVLKPGGRVLLLEHVRSTSPLLGRLMDILNPVVVRLAGANINRQTVENVRLARLKLVRDDARFAGVLRSIEAQPCQAREELET